MSLRDLLKSQLVRCSKSLVRRIATLNTQRSTVNFLLKIWRQANPKSKGEFGTYEARNISPNTSFLEMLDIVNDELTERGEAPIAFDSDCREGICGTCALTINGQAHGPKQPD